MVKKSTAWRCSPPFQLNPRRGTHLLNSPAHFLPLRTHKATHGKDRRHYGIATRLTWIALTYVPENNTALITRNRKGSSTECSRISDGVAFCRGWCRAPMKTPCHRARNAETFAWCRVVPRRVRSGPISWMVTLGLIDTARNPLQCVG